ncbi:MAG: SocA family protein [Proteobacteria bacterium]|nr:SocA family protein [Pseudomonadota bacterium]
MTISFIQFSPEKAVAALTYLINGTTNDMYLALKMLYVADKKHMAKSGRFIAGDNYVAMTNGATPSKTYDLVKFVRGDGSSHYGYPEVRNFFTIDAKSHQITLSAAVPEQLLSPIAKECLDEVIEEYQRDDSFRHWYNAAHDRAWTKTKLSHPITGAPEMSDKAIASTIPNSDALLTYLEEFG